MIGLYLCQRRRHITIGFFVDMWHTRTISKTHNEIWATTLFKVFSLDKIQAKFIQMGNKQAQGQINLYKQPTNRP